MKSRVLWLLIGVIMLILFFGVWRSKRFLNHQSAKPNSRADTVVPDASLSNSSGGTGTQATFGPSSVEFAAAHLTPILFYGKAVDQNGLPIPDATVTYRANNIPWGGGARSQMKTDASGEFQISSKGLSLYVEVSKDNYRSLPRRSDIAPGVADQRPVSSGTYPYAKQFAGTVHKPDNAHPVIFTLHKSGELERLINHPGKDLIMAKDGSPIRVELNPGNPKTVIEMQCWTDDKIPNAERHYDWRFKMTVLSGGLEERLDEIAFIAPPSGYEERSFDYLMKKELPGNQWRDEVAKSFFVRFEDDTYAILDVNMISGGGHFAVVSSRLNPKPGSRNLETAPLKKPKYR